MAATNRGGIHAVIPWVALGVVTIFAFNQLHRRNRAEDLLEIAERGLGKEVDEALESSAPKAAKAPVLPEITERERKLDEALLVAQEVVRGDTLRIAALEDERDRERGRADRLAALKETETARADAVAVRVAAAEAEAAKVAVLEEEMRAARGKYVSDLQGVLEEIKELQTGTLRIAKEKAEQVAALDQKLASERKAHTTDVTQLQQELAKVHEIANRRAIQATTAQSELARLRAGHEAEREQLTRALAAARDHVTELQQALHVVRGRLGQQEADWERIQSQMEKSVAAARDALTTLRKRLIDVTTLQLAAEESSNLTTGARLVGLLGLRGFTERLLALTDAEDPLVCAAAARGLAGAGDLKGAALEASDAAVALMGDEAIGVRMAGLDLLRAATGKKIDFDPGAPAKERAAKLETLKRRLGS